MNEPIHTQIDIRAYEPFFRVGRNNQLVQIGGEFFNRFPTGGVDRERYFTQIDANPEQALRVDCQTIQIYGQNRHTLHANQQDAPLDTVNVLLGSLMAKNAVPQLMESFAKAELSPQSVVAEIGEVRHHYSDLGWTIAARNLDRLQSMGLRVIYDDWAVGDVRQKKLQANPTGYKIEKGLTQRLECEGFDDLPSDFVETILDAAEGLDVICEGARPRYIGRLRAFFGQSAHNIAVQGWHLREGPLVADQVPAPSMPVDFNVAI